jgi:hypothetical protein
MTTESLEQKKARLRELRLAKEAADRAALEHTRKQSARLTPAERQRRVDIEAAILATKLHMALGDKEMHPVLKTVIIRGAKAAGVDTPF